MLYFAYGSNLNKKQMSRRCPAAIPIGPLMLPNARLVFRGVADIEHSPNDADAVAGGLWHITRQCERELDIYEGVRGGLYRKEYLQLGVTRNGVQTKEVALTYLMNRSGYDSPGQAYYDCISKGFEDFALDESYLIKAVERFSYASWSNDSELWER
jgi:hypothetical protein